MSLEKTTIGRFMMLNVRLKQLRKQKKKTQEEVANDLGIKRTTYAMYEQGNRVPDYAILVKFADYYGTSTDYLLGHTDDPSANNPTDIDLKSSLENPKAHWNGKPLTAKQREIALELLKTVLDRIESGETVEDEKESK